MTLSLLQIDFVPGPFRYQIELGNVDFDVAWGLGWFSACPLYLGGESEGQSEERVRLTISRCKVGATESRDHRAAAASPL